MAERLKRKWHRTVYKDRKKNDRENRQWLIFLLEETEWMCDQNKPIQDKALTEHLNEVEYLLNIQYAMWISSPIFIPLDLDNKCFLYSHNNDFCYTSYTLETSVSSTRT